VQESIDAVKQISSAQTLYALQSRLRAQQKAQEELRAAALTAPQQRTQAQVGTLLVLSHHHRRQPPTTTLLRAASRADNASCHPGQTMPHVISGPALPDSQLTVPAVITLNYDSALLL
jgi:hypothetical protein